MAIEAEQTANYKELLGLITEENIAGIRARLKPISETQGIEAIDESEKVEDSSLPSTPVMQAKARVAELGRNYMDTNGNRLIHVAASTSAAMVHVCANSYQPINTQNFNGDTALHIAVRANDEDITRALLMNGADLGIRNKLGQTAADIASRSCKSLLDLYKPGLPAVVQKGDPAALQRLVRLWCNPWAVIKGRGMSEDYYSLEPSTPLNICEARRNTDTSAQACHSILQAHKNTLALIHSVLSEDLEELKSILSQKGWNINVRYQNVKGVTPVTCAIQQHNLAILRCLVETEKCMLNVRVAESFSSRVTIPLLFLCLDQGCPMEIWNFLHEHVDPLQAMEKDKNGNTALLRAIANGLDTSFIQQLIDYRIGLGLLDRNSEGMHARELAAYLGRSDVVAVIDKALMDKVGDFFLLNFPVNFYGLENMDVKNEKGERLFDLVKEQEDVAAITMYQAVEDRAIELFDAATKGNVEEVKKLNTVVFRDKNGFTALTRAVIFKQAKVVEALVTSQPELKTTPDNNNRYPLHYAYALQDGQEIIDLLMDKHPDHIEHRMDKDGLEPAEYKKYCSKFKLRQLVFAAQNMDAYGQTIMSGRTDSPLIPSSLLEE